MSGRIAALGILLAGCGPEILQLPIEDDMLLVIGTRSGATVEKPRFEVFDGSAPIEYEVEGGKDDVVVFAWPRSALRTHDGNTVTKETLAEARIGADGEGCGRCTDGRSTEWQVMAPGDLCPAPTFARVYIGSVETPRDHAPASPKILWPGACGCSTADLLTRRDAEASELEAIEPADFPDPFTAIAEAPNDDFALFGKNKMVEARTGRAFETPFERSPDEAARLSNGYLVNAFVHHPESEFGDSLVFADMTWLDDEGKELGRFATPLIVVKHILPFGNRAIVAGRRAKRGPLDVESGSIWVCQTGSEVYCAEITPGHTETQLGSRILPDGRLVVVGVSGMALVYERVPEPLDVDTVESNRVLLRSGGEIAIAHFAPSASVSNSATSFGISGNRVYFCASSERAEGVISYPLSADSETDTKVARCGAGQCFGIFERPEGGATGLYHAYQTGMGQQVISIDPRGEVDSCDSLEETWGLYAVEKLWTTKAGSIVLRDDLGRWFARSSTGAVQRIHGPEARFDAVRTLAERDDEVWGFGNASAKILVGSTVDRVVTYSKPLPAPSAATAFGDDDFLVVVGLGTLVRLKVDGSVEHTELTIDGAASLRRVRNEVALVTASSSSRPAVFVVTADPELRSVELPMDWDDPATTTAEERPSGCTTLFVAGAKDGKAWVAGCDSAVFEVFEGPKGFEARRVSFVAHAADQLKPPSITSMDAVCGDRIIVGYHDSRVSSARVYELEGPSLRGREIETDGGGTLGESAEPLALASRAGEIRAVGVGPEFGFADRILDGRTERVNLPTAPHPGGILLRENDAYFLLDQGKLQRLRY